MNDETTYKCHRETVILEKDGREATLTFDLEADAWRLEAETFPTLEEGIRSAESLLAPPELEE
tara:strand:+ start:2872 stop:3060 length:189 start_codon:yes stop_codon:yes gene_type:complete